MSDQRRRARAFAELHRGPEILVLPNAWDAFSAILLEQAGFAAIGTTSAGVAAMLGYRDAEEVPVAELVAVLRRMVERVKIPVSADIEGGYGATPAAVGETVRRVVATGVVGINLEDARGEDGSLRPLDEQLRRLEAARRAAEAEGVELFINARTDVYWRGMGPAETRLPRALERVRAFREAGADGVFVPGVTAADEIRALAGAVDAPLNVLAGPGTPPVAELQALGVARVSLGSGPFRALAGRLRAIAAEVKGHGTFHGLMDGAVPYDEMQALLARAREGERNARAASPHAEP
ncbi:MAG TPA: isocitrate lyase/phosphoenolpyruvate mutase family protein [Bacillota bacterium]